MKQVIILIFVSNCFFAFAQDDLLSILSEEKEFKVLSTFKTTKIINGQSVELVDFGVLQFLIQHRFGTLNSGMYNFYGLDNAQVRFGFDYGFSDYFNLGIGRSSFLKTVDLNAKIKLYNQIEGKNSFPFTIVWYSAAFFEQSTYQDMQDTSYNFINKLSYAHQILIAQKINRKLSMQIFPSVVHKNLVTKDDFHDFLSIGIGGRYKLSSRISVNTEYFLQIQKNNSVSPFSIGLDIETGGHVFQLHLSNSPAMFERAFIHETNDKWMDGSIYFGFNISRVFLIKNRS